MKQYLYENHFFHHPFFSLLIDSALLLSQTSHAQCGSCDFTYPGGTTAYTGHDLNDNKRVCITSGTYSGSVGNINGSNNSICIAPGATVNWTGNFNNLTIEVYGTLNFNNGGFNGSVNRISIYCARCLIPAQLYHKWEM